ncbi:FxsA family protein [Candidatus Vesicomyidisocius calyptogenae]|uniref:FxsA protein n=1 Tax=Vesicomyosocius okutanii subsp. Calyptogena okutanii (strain HA) TaxID=412965 RepID=A5CVN8_VESOH|nr:FxsA family protein [Candidatus Vesicomyosocius okutanii]BAF61998.1 FxsA protein [Candidatus Vesicomyosocius okutanii]
MIFPIFVVMTLLEIYILASVGAAIGGFLTVLLVIITAFIGFFLLKQQGYSTIAKAQNTISNNQTSTFVRLEGVVIVVSGVLLLTPGFITDMIGLLGLLPFSRSYFINRILEKNAKKIFNNNHSGSIIKTQNNQPQQSNEKNTIEGEFWED